mmetsp:Transcript_5591/g.14314  ORF Transcript_5591/g.14314 Transcript_5591/m.14314 type:complete len:345 (+) Transcript_5591:100-1134(+)
MLSTALSSPAAAGAARCPAGQRRSVGARRVICSRQLPPGEVPTRAFAAPLREQLEPYAGAGPRGDDSASGPSRRGLLAAALLGLPAVSLLSSAVPCAQAAGGGAPLSPAARAAVDTALAAAVPKGKAPAVLRVIFHDAGTFDAQAGDGGANASVQFELSRPENKGLKRGLNCVTEAMKGIKGTAAEGEVSTADMIALAAAYAVRITGGPAIDVPVGRKDADRADPEGRLPAETLPVEALKANFAAKGFSVPEFVVLCGSHAIGNKGFGDALTFDSSYYTTLLEKPWDNPAVEMRDMIGLPSDRVLAVDAECLPLIEKYAGDQQAFFDDFAAAFVKLSVAGATWV